MLKNYLTIAWRNLTRNRNYALVNILGLAIGLACFMLIMLYVQDEVSYDKFHPEGERIYRMSLERKYPGRSREYAIIPAGYADVLPREFPEVEKTCRLFSFQEASFPIKSGAQVFEEKNFIWADTSFFDFFGIELLKGSAEGDFAQPGAVILTESMAKKYFGEAEPIGKVMDVAQSENDLKVTGVCADPPENTHLKFTMLVSAPTLNFIREPNYINFSALTYLMLSPNADPAALEAKFPDLVTKYVSGPVLQQFGVNYAEYQKQGNGYRYFLQHLPDIYLTSALESEMKPPGSQQRVYFFLVIAFLIILIACINFMNLATARSAGRAREVGIRKTLGSARGQIAGQFLMEAVVIAGVAAIIAFGLDLLVLPQFNLLTAKSYAIGDLLSVKYLLLLLAAAGVAGLLSGVYPALSLSAFKPIEVLRGKFMAGTRGAGLRNSLVVFQFGISIFLIICTVLVYNQLEHSQNSDLGFEKESVITLQNAGGMTYQQGETFKKELVRIPQVKAVSGCDNQPGFDYFGMSFQPKGANEMTTGSGVMVDEGYIECMGMEMVAGRSFSKDFMDTLSLMVNEAAAREMGLDDPIGKQVTSNDNFLNPVEGEQSVYTIVGVVKNFHFQSMHHLISPLFFVHNQRSFGSEPGVDPLVTVRLGAGDPMVAIEEMGELWQKFQPEVPFSYAFLDQDWAALYDKEITTRKVFGVFSMLAIFIACLGLLALAAFTAERRTKEIGVRKVLGATTGGIVALLAKDFLKLVVIALVIASPIAWYAMHEWLQDFHYRIDIEWWVFVVAGLAAVLVAFVTVSFQSIRAASLNPVESLQTE